MSRLSIFCFLLLTQCHWNDPPAKDTIVFGLSSEPKTLDPRFATDASGQRLGHLLFSSLVEIGPDLKIVGNLATQWSYNDKTYVFTIKPGLRFHNGEFVNRDDFLFSFAEYRKPRSPFAAQFKIIEKVEADYNHQTGGKIKIFLKNFSAPFLSDLALIKLLPKKWALEKGDDFYAHPMGTGPFVFEKRDLKNIFLVKNKNYHGESPKTEKLHFKVVKDSNTRFQKMYKGQIDIIQSDIPFSKVKFFETQPDFKVVVTSGLSTNYILLNLRHPLLKKIKVRQAISAAINRKELIRYTLEGFAEPATSILTQANPYYHRHLDSDPMPSEEIRDVFKKFAKKPLIIKTSNTQEAVAKGRVIVHQLRSLGLDIEQQTYEWGTYYEDVRTGNFDMAIMKWVGITDPDIYRSTLHSKMTPPGRNRGYYKNKRFDDIVDQAFQEPDANKRKALYTQAQEIVFHELPTIPLWYEKQVAIIHKRVKNYTLPGNGDFSSLKDVYKQDVTVQ